jgi:hypothetical protein
MNQAVIKGTKVLSNHQAVINETKVLFIESSNDYGHMR